MAPAFHTISVEAVSQVEEKLARLQPEIAKSWQICKRLSFFWQGLSGCAKAGEMPESSLAACQNLVLQQRSCQDMYK